MLTFDLFLQSVKIRLIDYNKHLNIVTSTRRNYPNMSKRLLHPVEKRKVKKTLKRAPEGSGIFRVALKVQLEPNI